MKLRSFFFCSFILLCCAAQALAVPTKITVRVKAKDAKFIGTSLGGVLITIKDVDTNELLAKGVTQGSTGDTKLLMKTPRGRFLTIARPQDGAYTATIDIDEPTRVQVTAYGPLAQRQGANTASATQWVMPGKDITAGNGWLIEMPGFVVDVLAPSSHIKLAANTTTVPLKANVTLMCGCPITPGGVWDANKYEVAADIIKGGKKISNVPLKYVGPASQYAANFHVANGPGVYKVILYAYDKTNGNTGVDFTTFIIKKK